MPRFDEEQIAQLKELLDPINVGLTAVEGRLAVVEDRLTAVEVRLTGVEQANLKLTINVKRL